MSELLQVAAALRKLSDADLHRLVIRRSVSTASIRDFFDLAEVLSSPKSISAAIASLPSSLAHALLKLAESSATSPTDLERLKQLLLADDSGLFESVRQALTEAKKTSTTEIKARPLEPIEPLGITQANIDSDAGLHAFETLQALTELVFDLEQRYVREVGKGNVGLPDIKRLALHLSKSNDYAKEIYDLAASAGLMTLVNSRWQLGSYAPQWLASKPEEQIAKLWAIWLVQIGADALAEICVTPLSAKAPVAIDQLLTQVFPFADSSVGSRNVKLQALTERIGLTAGGITASWFSEVVNEKLALASAEISKNLPGLQERIICQADLTLIATGPLPIQVEIQLRKFAETEVIGMASTYRLTALSITHGLETGLSEADIRGLLEKLSGKNLPQPVDYLIREASSRFGRLVVQAGEFGERSIVNSSDSILLTEILNDGNLKAFSLVRLEDGSLSSRFEAEVLYFGLREAGYAAIRRGLKGEIVSPLKTIAAAELEVNEDSILADIKRMREHEQKMGGDLDADEVNRPIQLAIKNKAKLEVAVVNNTGTEITFILEPIGIANGRLRAKDRKADIERTLPLTSIIRVAII